MTQYLKPPSTATDTNMTVEYAMFYPTQKVGGKKRRRTVMLIVMPVCTKTKDGFRDTVESYLDRNGITVVRLSSTHVAIVPDEKFVDGQVRGILDSVARYRGLTPDQLRRRRLYGVAVTSLRGYFESQMPLLLQRLSADAGTSHIITYPSG